MNKTYYLWHVFSIGLGGYVFFCIFYYQKVFDSLENVYEKPAKKEVIEKNNHIKFREMSRKLKLKFKHVGAKIYEETGSSKGISDRELSELNEYLKEYNDFARTNHGPMKKEDLKSAWAQKFINFVKRNKERLRRAAYLKKKLQTKQTQPRGPAYSTRQFLPSSLSVFPSVSLIDIDQDGWIDVFFPGSKGRPNKLYKNHKGVYFENVASQYGIANTNKEFYASMGYFIDFNLDGHTDLLIARWGCHDLYLGQGPHKPFLIQKDALDAYCSLARNVNFFDFNKDGLLDIVFANIGTLRSLETLSWDTEGVYIGNKLGGGENRILEGLPNGKFRQRQDLNFNKWRSYTQGVGIMDFNHDGWEDVFFTNNYSTDEVWINQKGKKFVDQTEKYFPKYKHGFSGMNTEVYDLDDDGLYEIYISNSYKPPYRGSLNNLWRRSHKGEGFSQMGDKLGIARCGFAWASKFADFDNDGDYELLAVNGRTGLVKKGQYNSFWYYQYELTLMPRLLRKYRKKKRFFYYRYSGHERNCFFVKDGGKYHDIAPFSGIDDILDGRGLALADLENNGKMDFLVANLKARALVYQNFSATKGSWLGVEIKNQSLKSHLIGMRVILETEKGRKIHRLYNPFHGFKAQSDARIHFGLGEDKAKILRIFTRDGREIVKKDLRSAKYNIVKI